MNKSFGKEVGQEILKKEKEMDTEWFEDKYGAHIFWIPREQILGVVQEKDDLWIWEARVDHEYRITECSPMGKAPNLDAAKNIVESILTEVGTLIQEVTI